MDPQANSPKNKRLLYLVVFLVLATCVYFLTLAISDARNTGILEVDSTSPEASLSITQANSEAKTIGAGKAKIRLKPGDYIVAAAVNGSESSAAVNIIKNDTRHVTLDPFTTSTLPSAKNVNFSGLYSLVNHGVTSGQITALKYAFFKYKTTAQAVEVDPNTVYPGPHDLQTGNFTIRFTVTIDASKYNASISYSGLSKISLSLNSIEGSSSVFDSGVISM